MQNVININFTNNFLSTFAQWLMQHSQQNNILLADYTILVNNINLSKPLQTALLQQSNTQAMLMPNIVTLNNLHSYVSYNALKDNTLYNQHSNAINANTINKVKRSFMLSQLIAKKNSNYPLSVNLQMATELGKLIDEANLQNINLQNLHNIKDTLQDNLATHWLENLNFLEIATTQWPHILQENNLVDESFKQNQLYQIFNSLIAKPANNNYIIALNIISTHKNVFNIINTINNLPNGKIITYGLNTTLYSKCLQANQAINYLHPQAPLQHTLLNSNIKANDITNHNLCNNLLINDLWEDEINTSYSQTAVQNIFNNISIVKHANTTQEAKTVALLVRKYIQDSSKSIAILANDFTLINKIKHELSRYNLELLDRLGESLIKQPQTEFFLLVLNALCSNLNAIDLLALLKHNHFNYQLFNLNLSDFNQTVDFIDKNIVRESNPTTNIQHYIAKCTNYNSSNSKHKHTAQLASQLCTNLQDFFTNGFAYINNNSNYSFNTLLQLTIQIAQNLCITNAEETSHLWLGNAGKELYNMLNNLLQNSNNFNLLGNNVSNLQDYNQILHNFLSSTSVYTVHGNNNLYLYGKMQANLVNHSIVIMCGLTNNTPSLSTINPWVSNFMLKQLGFVDANYSIALQNYMFCQVLANKQVILTYSNKTNAGEATFESKWLMQINNIYNYYHSAYNLPNNLLHKYNYLINVGGQLNKFNVASLTTYNYKQTTVSSKFLPLTISATNLELLQNNQYSFFVKNVLNLKPLSPIVLNQQDAKDFGTIMHNALQTITSLNPNYSANINKIAYNHFKHLLSNSLFVLFSWHVITVHLNTVYNEHKNKNATTYTEKQGKSVITVGNYNITITAKFDRIDQTDQTLTIIDYKTSNTAKYKDWFLQLPLTGWLAINNNIPQITANNIAQIQAFYWFLPKNSAKSQQKSFNDYIAKASNTTVNCIDYIKNFNNVIQDILAPFYNSSQATFVYNVNSKDIDQDHRYFNRYLEWYKEADLELAANSSIIDDEELEEGSNG